MAGALVALGLLALAASGPAGAANPSGAATPSGARVLFHLQDQRIDEASGISPGIRSKGVDYVENDSGDTNRFFALNAKTGATAAVVTVPGAVNHDWEDLQVARDASGTPSVWIADIGDNDGVRREMEVYRVREPLIDPDDHDDAVTSARPAIWRLRYPTGPTDAESLAVTPGGDAYLVTKNVLGLSSVYRLPSRPDSARVQTLRQVGTIPFRAAKGRSPIGSVGGLLATSAAVSRDGRLLAVRSYIYADVWRLDPSSSNDGVVAALHSAPTRVALPAQRQGEGIAFDGHRLLIDAEGTGTPVWTVPLPASLLSAAPSTPAKGSSSAPASGSTRTRSPTPARGHSGAVTAVIVVLLFGTVILLGRRARRIGGGR